jgi:hypothetical protein
VRGYRPLMCPGTFGGGCYKWTLSPLNAALHKYVVERHGERPTGCSCVLEAASTALLTCMVCRMQSKVGVLLGLFRTGE